MKLNRFIIDFDLTQKFLKTEETEIINQIHNVLRLKAGDKIILADGKFNESIAEIKQIGKNFIDLEILKIEKNKNESLVYTILYCSILKKENFELVVQKAVECGIKEITPIITKRTVKLNIKEDRFRKIIKEAAEQSGRGVLPILNSVINFKEALAQARQNNLNLFFDPIGIDLNKEKFKIKVEDKIGLFIGPEGGWEKDEINLARENNFQIVSLGSLVLRAETAAAIVSYLANFIIFSE